MPEGHFSIRAAFEGGGGRLASFRGGLAFGVVLGCRNLNTIMDCSDNIARQLAAFVVGLITDAELDSAAAAAARLSLERRRQCGEFCNSPKSRVKGTSDGSLK